MKFKTIVVLVSTIALLIIASCAPGAPLVVQQSAGTPVAGPTDIAFKDKDQITLVHSGAPGALVEHPWTAMVDEYNRTHPNVYVTLQLVPGDFWQVFGTWVASGNLPDLIRATPAGMFQNRGKIPGLVDPSPIIEEADRSDLGASLGGVTLPDGTILGYPLARNFGDWPCVDKKVLEDALPAIGLSKWQDIYAKGGWTWDDWNKVASRMTEDVNGKHPGDAGFDDKNVKRWAFVIFRDYANSVPFLAALNNDVPDASSGVGMMMWGNSYNWTGPKVAEALQWWSDWHTKYKIASPSTLAINSDTETYNGIARGEFASTWDFPDWCRSVIRDYNAAVDRGEIAGQKVDREMVILPLPHHEGFPGAHVDRSVTLSIFKQNPYKGDQHMQNVFEFAKWLMAPERQLAYCEWANCIPARQSAATQFSKLKTDENFRAYYDYALKTSNPTFPFSHPIAIKFFNDTLTPILEQLANGTLTGEQADKMLAEAADKELAEWIKTADPDIVSLWSKPPPGWPGSKYPDWKIRTSQSSAN